MKFENYICKLNFEIILSKFIIYFKSQKARRKKQTKPKRGREVLKFSPLQKSFLSSHSTIHPFRELQGGKIELE